MSDEHQEHRIAPSTESQWQAEAHRLSALAKDRGKEIESLLKEKAALTAERDQLKADLDTVSEAYTEQEATIGDLTGKLRGHSYKAEFARLAKEAGVDPDFADDLYDLAKLDTTAEEPDAKAIGARLAELKQAKPRYFLPEQGEGDGEQAGSKQQGGLRLGDLPEGTSTGGRQAAGGNRGSALVVRKGDLGDPNFMLRNSGAVNAAYAAGDLNVN